MFENHLTRELLRAIAEERLPAAALVRLAWRHLLDLCPTCRQEYEAWQRERRQGEDYGPAFERLRERFGAAGPALEEERRQAERELAALVSLPAGERVRKVERARKRFRGALLAERLVEEGRGRMPGAPEEAQSFFQAAKAVLYRSGEMEAVPHLWARVLAHLGNAVRVGWEDLRQAEVHFRDARAFLTRFQVADPLVLAEVDCLEGSLRRDQRRFREAEELLRRASSLYHLAGEKREAARILIKLGTVYGYEGECEQAVAVCREAVQVLESQQDPRLFWCAVHSLAFFLCDDERHGEAREVLEAHRPLYRRFSDSWTQLRLRWLEGKIAAGLGEEERAEEALQAARAGFAEQGLGYDTALVSLELAVLYAAQGRTGDIQRLAEEILPLFEAREIHREALCTLLLFRDAARAERLTQEAAREMAAVLQRLRREPSARPHSPC